MSSPRRALSAPIVVDREVRLALRAKRGVVALESSVFAQGLPRPSNAEAAARMLRAITSRGGVPAVTAVIGGSVRAGVSAADLRHLLDTDGIPKVSTRDLPAAIARRTDGATTVAASMAIAHRAAISVFATGGIGGVHRGDGIDESADLLELSRTSIIVVCAGPKAILDLRATAERCETLGVPVVGYRTDWLPAFYTTSTDVPVSVRCDTVAEVVALYRAHRALGLPGALLVVQPPPEEAALPRRLVESAVERALAEADKAGVWGGAVTPFLLAAVERATDGRSLAANLALLESNAALAADIAVQLAKRDPAKNR